MKKKAFLLPFIFICFLKTSISQEKMFYGTIKTKHATKLKQIAPNDIFIISSQNEFSAVKLSHNAAEKLHHMILTHGPGFIYEDSEESALKTIHQIQKRQQHKQMVQYTISEEKKVKKAMDLVNNLNIAKQIKELENYGTRYHTTQKATQAVTDLKQKWENMAKNRSDVSVRLVYHRSSSMPSVIMTIKGKEKPNEHVIIGGHIDSVSPRRTTHAPGADDNASGIATITEVARVLFEMNFQPKRTLEFMAYAAEEVGLRGSREIAQDYKNRNVNVLGYVQFDMTNYKGSPKDIYITDDTYNSNTLNSFLINLLKHYNANGSHKLTYDFTRCNYGCSDHYSWSQQGYHTAFPLEASFRGSNPHIHTVNDTFDRSPTPNATHAAKFVKLGLAFLIEASKSAGSIDTPSYCTLKSNNINDEYIQKVILNNLNNLSGATNGYQDFTSMSANISKKKPQHIEITPKWTGTIYSEAYTVWIDYNQDGVFNNINEKVWTKSPTKESKISGSFSVPKEAKLGKTRMRIAMRYNTIQETPCGSFTYGEVEDYTVIISENTVRLSCNGIPQFDASKKYALRDKVIYQNIIYQRTNKGWKKTGNCPTAINSLTQTNDILVNDNEVINISPNPSNKHTVTFTVNNELWRHEPIIIYNIHGQQLQKNTLKSKTENINIANLPPGTYFISLQNTDNKYSKKLIKK